MGDPVAKGLGVDQDKGQGPTVSNISAGISRQYAELMNQLMNAKSSDELARLLSGVSLDPQDTAAALMLKAVKESLVQRAQDDQNAYRRVENNQNLEYAKPNVLVGMSADWSVMAVLIVKIEVLRSAIKVIQASSVTKENVSFALDQIVPLLNTELLEQVLKLTPEDKQQMVLRSLNSLLTKKLSSENLLKENRETYTQMLSVVSAHLEKQ